MERRNIVGSRSVSAVLLTTMILVTIVGTLAVGPKQAERPPQPFFQDFFSGHVLLRGTPPPAGTLLIACIGRCEDGFQSAPYRLKEDGSFDQLEVNPDDERLVGNTISFYLVNDFGSIRALETRPYIGVFDFYRQDLTFVDPMPLPAPKPTIAPTVPAAQPTPTAKLPISGDPVVAGLPMLIVISGLVLGSLGGGLMFLARRRFSYGPG